MATKQKVEETTEETVEEPVEEVEETPAKKPTLRLQARYKNYRMVIVPTRRVFHPGMGVEIIPGTFVRFEGPQRIFDSEVDQRKHGYDDEMRDNIERKLVTSPRFMNVFFPAPMSPIPDHLLEIARVRPPAAKRYCIEFGWDEGELVQCKTEAGAGSQYCATHDPERTRIVIGGGTT